MSTVLTAMPSPLTIKVFAPSTEPQAQVLMGFDTMDDTLFDQDFELGDDSYDSDMTDASSALSSINCPTYTEVKVASSPCSVDGIALASGSAWSARPARRKRARMSEDERKVRHREVQRQFMKRKRARIAVLRKEQCGVEKQLRLVRVLVEVEMLKNEKEALQQQYGACAHAEPASPPTVDASTPAMSLGDLVFSVPSEDTHEDYVMTELDWSELYDVLCDDASDDTDESLPTVIKVEV